MPSFKAHTFSSKEIVSAATLQSVQDCIDALAPVGSYLLIHQAWSTSGVLVNGMWLPCDGALVAISSFPTLFTKIGTTYGSGSGLFGVPDWRGRTPIMAAASGSSDAVLGASDGAAVGSRRPKHQHTVNSSHSHLGTGSFTSSGASAQHTHTAAYPTSSNTGKNAISRPYGGVGSNPSTDTQGNHTHAISGTFTSASTAVTAVGVAGLTDTAAYLVCCSVYIRAV